MMMMMMATAPFPVTPCHADTQVCLGARTPTEPHRASQVEQLQGSDLSIMAMPPWVC